MDLTQSDRDKLRASQHKLHNDITIGNLIEHKIQDPKVYKQASGLERIHVKDKIKDNKMPGIRYKSKFLTSKEPVVHLRTLEEDLETDLPISLKDVQANLWLNMDQVEFDKLEWMTSKADRLRDEQLKDVTVFNKDGLASKLSTIPANGASDTDHAESHDIQSLTKLLDSTYIPQVNYALRVITKISSLATVGFYDGAFDENIHGYLIKNCLLRVRHHIDSSNETLNLGALKCLRSLLCNTHVDEVNLDRIFPLTSSEHSDPNMWLVNHNREATEFTPEMKDNQCVEVDAILALIKCTNILVRFSFLLEDKSLGTFSILYQECILDILIRMARHSPEVCDVILTESNLTKALRSLLVTNISNETKKLWPVVTKALKLLRIIGEAISDEHFEDSRHDQVTRGKIPVDIMTAIQSYFFIDCFNLPSNQPEHLFRLHIETLRIMKVLSKLKQFRGEIVSLMALGEDRLHYSLRSISSLKPSNMTNCISFDWQYAAHIIDLIGSILRCERYHLKTSFMNTIWETYVQPLTLQWLSQTIRSGYIPHIDVSIAIATSVNYFKDRSDAQASLVETMLGWSAKGNVKSDHNTSFFKTLALAASKKSQLPNLLEEVGKLRDPKFLPSYGLLNFTTGTRYEFRLSPLFETQTPYILLNMFISQLLHKKVGNTENLKLYINNIHLVRYIRSITGYQRFPMDYEAFIQQSLGAQYEVRIICFSLLLLSRYLLESDDSFDSESGESYMETSKQSDPDNFECYSNLCYQTISSIGLLNNCSNHMVSLKDQLFEKVLLNVKLQTKVSKEALAKKCNIEEFMDFTTGDLKQDSVINGCSQVLLPVYVSCAQPNRFWIFQPMLDYYHGQLKDCNEVDSDQKKRKDNRWFEFNVDWRVRTGALASCTDIDIICINLEFNVTMMMYSPTYLKLVVQANVEDYLCIIGSIFLDDDLFLDEKLGRALASNLKKVLNECLSKDGVHYTPFKDASKIIEPLNLPLADFFNKLVEQYSSVSYGDLAFTNFLLLFITPGSDKIFRRRLFQEEAETCLGLFRLSVDSLWAPQALFFGQLESDPEIKSLIRRCIPAKTSFLDYYRNFHIRTSI